MLTEKSELEKILLPILKANGSEIPPFECVNAAVEFDENGEVVAYQMVQNCIFLEGLWSRDNTSHLRNLHRMALTAAEKLGAKRVMTLTRNDEAGDRIARLAQALGYEQMKWNVFRRKL